MPKVKTELNVLQGTLCDKCVGLCCNYITIRIDKPTTKREKDDIRWYLLHEGITILIADDDWQVKVPTPCEKLGMKNECTIYETRPETCREYSTDNCDFHTVFEGWGTDYIEIETPEAFADYLEKKKKSRKQKAEPKKNGKHAERI